MTTINQAYINALLADAAYVNVTQGMNADALKSAIDDRMTSTQAAYLAANFELVGRPNNTSDNPFEGGSGFDAVVWRIKIGSEFAGPNYLSAGKVSVSMRGTELPPGASGTDLIDDINLANPGVPRSTNSSKQAATT